MVFSQGAVVPLRELLLVLLVSAVVTMLSTGGIRVLAIGFGAIAVPRDRDVHLEPIPRMGGVGIYLGVLAAVLFAHQLPALRRGFDYPRDIPAVLVAGTLIVLVGIVDDRWGLDALTKFVGQISAAGAMAVMGLSWVAIYNPFSNTTVVLDQLQGWVVTVAITVTMINAMNFVDGLDGLAAGLGLIAAAAVFVFTVGLLYQQGGATDGYPPALLAAALAGGCLGFLPHNFHPARIFMGDSGSMLIGLMLAAVSTGASGRIPLTGYGPRDIVGLLSPLLLVGAVMFIPVLDLVLAIVRRVRAGVSFSTPDKMHLHHRLLQIGHSHRRVVLLIYLWVGVLAFAAVGTSLMDRRVVVLLFAAGLVFALVVTAVPSLREVVGLRGRRK
ncbi:undecaprenyl-phosphate alpha-N-acetylglucosaminyl 1-phosphate transferase [Nocardia sp. 852002-20019_SCH5090214]|jgi:UDP-GlcNAc:undecaprenyl-phosphate GlcNAc-1-phosphate transferase|uniref:Decaprenyl-phosphate N-acetylglucosaminephosphotransferase n=5 Tax=Nocardia TaxID=1817 RepID=A0A231GUB0_9NOCA|nr:MULTISPECIES: MraY family glycosyltransferase [Nocardia]OBF78057.1 undecaprenyl-phosphate alpha-N-acetylglucosaminyl 1-phosphate transferase [Mycobacterium sp. 852002-51759_SCH5129042]MBF4997751.1 undecaprenyl/decaprenyl-phosphate alpha-N-acetylglucosaminyl 1-phosphate transferase [Nocardia sp. BSTN01]MBF6241970.1 undecaprenyl/decaprenyl-phosphate alpha-N-acetylglucosaminyl 1-phosphate transferase [Nocardia elegans]MBF6276151.1 undecaprenyl/decaprenyl-phosphate alpha-N-acetylglucosaminyl 1-p